VLSNQDVDEIDRKNSELLSKMDEQEILRQQELLKSMLSSKALNFLKKSGN
jgi:hypothetical protein